MPVRVVARLDAQQPLAVGAVVGGVPLVEVGVGEVHVGAAGAVRVRDLPRARQPARARGARRAPGSTATSCLSRKRSARCGNAVASGAHAVVGAAPGAEVERRARVAGVLDQRGDRVGGERAAEELRLAQVAPARRPPRRARARPGGAWPRGRAACARRSEAGSAPRRATKSPSSSRVCGLGAEHRAEQVHAGRSRAGWRRARPARRATTPARRRSRPPRVLERPGAGEASSSPARARCGTSAASRRRSARRRRRAAPRTGPRRVGAPRARARRRARPRRRAAGRRSARACGRGSPARRRASGRRSRPSARSRRRSSARAPSSAS